MKVSLITLHRVQNFGSLLQTYATVKYLESRGDSVEVVDYIQYRLTQDGLRKDIYKTSFANNKNKIKALLSICLRIIFTHINKNKVDSFLQNYIPLSQRKYYDIKDFIKNPIQSDIYVVGSDQVWNSTYNGQIDLAMFLDYTPDTAKRISYASSFGKSKLDLNEKENTQYLLSKFSSISVREDSGLSILGDLGLNGKHVLDPTFLLNKEQWIDFSKNSTLELKKEKYLLIYTVHLDSINKLLSIAKKIAKQRNLKIYLFSYGTSYFKKADKVFNFATNTPQDFIKLFANADFVLACSFHGAAFSINLNKEFLGVAPNNFGTRAKSILEAVGLQDRYYENQEYDWNQLNEDIKYDEVNLKLESLRLKSKEFIQDAFYI